MRNLVMFFIIAIPIIIGMIWVYTKYFSKIIPAQKINPTPMSESEELLKLKQELILKQQQLSDSQEKKDILRRIEELNEQIANVNKK